VHSLLLAPWLIARGIDYAAADQLSSVLFAGAVLAIFAAGAGLDRARGAWVGAAAAALALTAPLYRLFGTLAMLEMPGAFLLALTLALWIRESRRPGSRGATIAAGLSTTALFLCKYNYGLLWLPPLAWHVWSTEEAGMRARIRDRVRAALRERRWLRPFPLLVIAYALGLLAILVTGGGAFRIGGTWVSIRSPGNPAYLLYVVLLARGALAIRRGGGARVAWGRLSPRLRALAATVAIPLGVWFLIPVPNRVKELFGFVTNRVTGPSPWTAAGLLDYPRVFVHEYAPAPVAGWIVLALACVPRRSRRPADRLLDAAFAFGFLATVAHRDHDPRFLFTTALLAWLRAARTAVEWADVLLKPLRKIPWAREAVWTAALLTLLIGGWRLAPSRASVAEARRLQNSPAAFVPVLDRVLEEVDRARGRCVVLGFSNWLSPGLLHWEALRRSPDAPWRPPARAPAGPVANGPARAQGLRAPIVIAALPYGPMPPQARDYLAEVRPDSALMSRLESAPGSVVDGDEVSGTAELPIRICVIHLASVHRMTGP
ncbi:MAG TPA: hypothetical protein VMS88_06790, partial [Terriglobales bacterium]|nr:hypothetical protein [Terriglobales bacterium]